MIHLSNVLQKSNETRSTREAASSYQPGRVCYITHSCNTSESLTVMAVIKLSLLLINNKSARGYTWHVVLWEGTLKPISLSVWPGCRHIQGRRGAGRTYKSAKCPSSSPSMTRSDKPTRDAYQGITRWSLCRYPARRANRHLKRRGRGRAWVWKIWYPPCSVIGCCPDFLNSFPAAVPLGSLVTTLTQ